MERKIGEIFEFKKDWYQCVEGRCKDCHFSEKRFLCKQFITKDFCTHGIIFKKLKRLGEPYKFDGYIFQAYRTFEVPIFIENYATVREVGNNFKISIEIKQNKENMEEKKQKLDDLVGLYTSAKITYKEFDEKLKTLYADKEECKSSLKEFDINLAKAGKPVCTRDGRKARIICFDRKGYNMFPIVALIMNGDRESDIYTYRPNGTWDNSGNESDKDLMMLPEKKEGWVNVYYDNDASSHRGCRAIYDTKEQAVKYLASDKQHIATVKIEWEE